MKKNTTKSINSIFKIETNWTKQFSDDSNYLLVAFSGGQDSTCLIFLLLLLKNRWNCILFISYCNHLWQKNNIYILKQSLNFCFIFKINSCFSVTSQIIATEQKARNWRYQSLQRIAQIYKTHTLVTGHTSTDRTETIIYNLSRGSGSLGVVAFSETKKIVANYLKKQKFPPSRWCFCDPVFNAPPYTQTLWFEKTTWQPLRNLSLSFHRFKQKRKWIIIDTFFVSNKN